MKVATSNERIEKLLEYTGDRPVDMANKANLSRSTITRYLNGSFKPTQETIDKIASAYNVNPAWFRGYDVNRMKVSDKQILNKINMLTERDKLFVLNIIDFLTERGKNEYTETE